MIIEALFSGKKIFVDTEVFENAVDGDEGGGGEDGLAIPCTRAGDSSTCRPWWNRPSRPAPAGLVSRSQKSSADTSP